MICADYGCQCAIESDSLVITGSGAQGDPWGIEANFVTICTSTTRPASPFTNQFIFETNTRRVAYWDGTFWRYVAGDLPEFNLQRQSTLSIPDDTTTTVTLPTEVVDTDAFHASSDDGFATIPTGLGGEYLLIASVNYAADADGYRHISLVVASNAGAPTQNLPRNGGFQMTNTNNNGLNIARYYTLEAGATVTLQTHHTAGSALNVATASLQGRMIRHQPELT
jgi:hypothetical protein